MMRNINKKKAYQFNLRRISLKDISCVIAIKGAKVYMYKHVNVAKHMTLIGLTEVPF